MITQTLRLSSLVASLLLALVPTVRAAVTENFNQTYDLAPNGTISLTNVNGDIEIVAWDKAQVSVEAVKSAKDEERLKLITIEVDAQPAKLSLKTRYAKSGNAIFNNNQGSVRYKLMVPTGVSLRKIDSTNSDLTITGVRGAIDLETTNGTIKATGLTNDASVESTNGSLNIEFASLENAKDVKLDTTNGRVTLTLPKGGNARVHADTTNGSVKVEQAITLAKSGKREIKGQIGSGGPSIEIETTNGSITVKEAK